MTKELFYLALTALLTGTLWLPYIIGIASSRGPLQPEQYKKPPTGDLPDWVNRANRAHMNAVETFAPFAVIVIVLHLAGISTPLTGTLVMSYFWIRVAHAIVHLSGVGVARVRTLLFMAGYIVNVTLFVQIIRGMN